MNRPKLLDLFSGAGGSAMGYFLAGFQVVGIDNHPQPHYPFDLIQADALEFLADGGWKGFDAIHASPPCQAYIQRNKHLATRHPRLIVPVRELLVTTGLPYVIENVLPEVLLSPIMLCGTQFGLKVLRHRYFEVNWGLILARSCYHWGTVAEGDFAAVYAFGGKGHRHGKGKRDPKSKPAPDWGEAMGIDWMTSAEMTQAIPPVYSEFIGQALMALLGRCV